MTSASKDENARLRAAETGAMLEENAKLSQELERLRAELDQSRLLLVSLKEDFHATGKKGGSECGFRSSSSSLFLTPA